MTVPRELLAAGEQLYARLREVEEEFGPDEDYEGGDLGWDGVAVAMSAWRRARRAAPALEALLDVADAAREAAHSATRKPDSMGKLRAALARLDKEETQ